MTNSYRRAVLSLVLVAGLLLGPAGAQAQSLDYSKGNSHIPNLFAPYMRTPVPLPTLANSPRLNDLIRDGKLYLSLQDGIYLALENNLDIANARYEPAFAEIGRASCRGRG